MVVPRKDGSEEAKVLLVTVEGQDVAGKVWRLLVVRVALALFVKTSRAKQRRHPVVVLIGVQEGEVKSLRAAGRRAETMKIKIQRKGDDNRVQTYPEKEKTSLANFLSKAFFEALVSTSTTLM